MNKELFDKGSWGNIYINNSIIEKIIDKSHNCCLQEIYFYKIYLYKYMIFRKSRETGVFNKNW